MCPFKMNKVDIVVRTMQLLKHEFHNIFREPSSDLKLDHKRYSLPLRIEEIAQFNNKEFNKRYYNDDNNELKSDATLIISSEDIEYIESEYAIELKRGDLVIEVGGVESDFVIEEIKPRSFLNGEPMLYYLLLKNRTKAIGGVK